MRFGIYRFPMLKKYYIRRVRDKLGHSWAYVGIKPIIQTGTCDDGNLHLVVYIEIAQVLTFMIL